MGADLSNSGDDGPINGINVTPFVDVVLVLLVIFMLTAPLLVQDALKVQLPKSGSSDQKSSSSVGLSITKEGLFLWNGIALDESVLLQKIKEEAAKNSETQVLISADTKAQHGFVVKAIDLVKKGGLNKFALQVERQ